MASNKQQAESRSSNQGFSAHSVGFSWSHRVIFSPSRGSNPGFFQSCWFICERWRPCGIFTKPWRQPGHFCLSPEQLIFRGLTRVVFSQTGRVFSAQRRNSRSSPSRGKRSPEILALGKSPQRRLRVDTSQALDLRSACCRRGSPFREVWSSSWGESVSSLARGLNGTA